MYNKKEIGQRLSEFSQNFKSKAEFARQLNVTPQTLTDYFNGNTAPGELLLTKLENLGCDIVWLIFGTTQPLQSNTLYSDITELDKLRNRNHKLETEIGILKARLEEKDNFIKLLLNSQDLEIKPNFSQVS